MKISEVLAPIPRDELTKLLHKSDARALWIVIANWLMVSACFALIIFYPFVWSWIIASAILAGRQLGLAILMHDCSHNALFNSTEANKFFGKWFCAAPVMADLDRYRTYHLEHHRTTGTNEDPDRSNYINYPVSKQSFRRKIIRDMVGITGFKVMILVLKMNAGTVKYQLAYDSSKHGEKLPFSKQFKNIAKNLGPTVIVHAIMIGVLYLLNVTWAYSLWWLAWMTFYMVFSRIRNAAEHGSAVDYNDPNVFKNTRTTIARWFERLTVAPNRVNYHLEHHVLATVPSYNLPAFHTWLKKLGHYDQAKLAHGYGDVVRDLIK